MSSSALVTTEAISQSSSIWSNLMPIALIMGVFYFLLLRPQQKRMKEHQSMVKALAKGDQVVFAGGMIGIIVKADETPIVLVEIAPEVRIKIRREAVTEIMKDPLPTSVEPKQLKKPKKISNK